MLAAMLISLLLLTSHVVSVAREPLPSIGLCDFDSVIDKCLSLYDEKRGLLVGGFSLKQAIAILGEPQIRGGYLDVEEPMAGRFVKAPDSYVWLGRDGYISLRFNASPLVGFMVRAVHPRIMAPIIVTARLLGAHP
jgi:hypothetical protein